MLLFTMNPAGAWAGLIYMVVPDGESHVQMDVFIHGWIIEAFILTAQLQVGVQYKILEIWT